MIKLWPKGNGASNQVSAQKTVFHAKFSPAKGHSYVSLYSNCKVKGRNMNRYIIQVLRKQSQIFYPGAAQSFPI